ncbi:MAG: corrinoid protein [Candidatus Methanofastidiosia archaeon]
MGDGNTLNILWEEVNNLTDKEEILKGLAEAVIKGNEEKCVELARKALEEGVDPYNAIMNGCNAGMKVVSDKYEKKEMFVPEILLSADAMYAALDILKPHLKVDATVEKPAKIVIGVAQGDIHDIGKNLVKMMLDVAGFEIVDLGRDIAPEAYIEKANEINADIVAISALMTTSMTNIEPVIKGIKDKNLKTKVIVGGAPINADFAEKIGADGYGKDAVEAIRVAKKLVEV